MLAQKNRRADKRAPVGLAMAAFACNPTERPRVEMSFSMMKARIAEAPDESDRRRSPRIPIELDVKMRELGESGAEARVLNISEHGFMAESDAHFEVGARIWLILPGRERASAVVKWTAGDKLGAEFSEPISTDGLQR
jgi:hypothetical protein